MVNGNDVESSVHLLENGSAMSDIPEDAEAFHREALKGKRTSVREVQYLLVLNALIGLGIVLTAGLCAMK